MGTETTSDGARGQPTADADGDKVSVAQLIARRLDEQDPWRLALVQRSLVWDEVRMAGLLDSLLAGYPIGSILICRVRQDGHVLRERGSARVAEGASPGTWQLLDGQQRINALITLFTEHGNYGRFYLDMTKRRVPEEVVTRRRDARRALDYIVWRPDDMGGADPMEGRERFIDLGRLAGWAAGKDRKDVLDLATFAERDPTRSVEILNAIDPAFADELPGEQGSIASTRLARLLRTWAEPAIPVQYFTVDGPLDVLQVFTRINLAGVQVEGEDVFFAAVKTEWPDAEEHLDRVAAATSLLNRATALRLLARLASRARSRDDLLPLRVDRLNGSKGKQLIRVMERLAADGSPVLFRLGTLGRLLTDESRIGYGLHSINNALFDHVFGWAAVHPQGADEAAMRAHLHELETYLVGAHAFRYATVFRDGFLTLAFAEAVAAGAAGDPFPTERILTRTARTYPGLRRGQNAVAGWDTDTDRRRWIDQSASLFLSVLQNISYQLPERDGGAWARGRRQVEWDHIYPQAKADRMRTRHPDTGRLVYHGDRRLVWEAGNLWALDRPLNNHARDIYPSAKFELLHNLPDETHRLPSAWPEVGSEALNDEERRNLLAAEELLRKGDVEVAMPLFRQYVTSRGLRLFNLATRVFAGVEQFVPGAQGDVDAFEAAAAVPLLDALDLEDEATPLADTASVSTSAADDASASVFALADRAGLRDEVQSIVAAAVELGLSPRPRKSSVMVAPRANGSRMLFTIWPQTTGGGRLSIYRWAQAIAEFFPSVEEHQARETLGPDGFGVLEREDVPTFISNLRDLLGEATQGTGGAPQLSGEELARAAEAWLRATDPPREGVHYYEIAHAVERQGPVGGADRMGTVLNVMRRRGDRFIQTRRGHYTWAQAAAAQATDRGTRYWAMRTDQNRRAELWDELRAGRLRQGWGWDPEMDLEVVAERVAAGETLSDWQRQAWDNRRMLTSRPDGVHVGDLVVVLHMPEPRRFSLARVTGDYEFDGGQLLGDYGHILPVEVLSGLDGVSYTDARLSPRLQTSLGNRPRMWNLDGFGPEIIALVESLVSSDARGGS